MGLYQHAFNGLLRAEGEDGSFLIQARNRFEQVDLHVRRVVTEQPHQMRQQVVIADERRNRVGRAITQIADRDRLQVRAAVDRR